MTVKDPIIDTIINQLVNLLTVASELGKQIKLLAGTQIDVIKRMEKLEEVIIDIQNFMYDEPSEQKPVSMKKLSEDLDVPESKASEISNNAIYRE